MEFEKGEVGGRAATHTFRDHTYETGASIIHTSNKYLVNFSKEFGEWLLIATLAMSSLSCPSLSLVHSLFLIVSLCLFFSSSHCMHIHTQMRAVEEWDVFYKC